jgi:hypothetical protein
MSATLDIDLIRHRRAAAALDGRVHVEVNVNLISTDRERG